MPPLHLASSSAFSDTVRRHAILAFVVCSTSKQESVGYIPPPPHLRGGAHARAKGANALCAHRSCVKSAYVGLFCNGMPCGCACLYFSYFWSKPPHQRGGVYSVDEGRRDSWTKELQAHIDNLRRGKGESGEKFSYRLSGSAVADVHRTLVREETESENLTCTHA